MKTRNRCWWCGEDPLYVDYHDKEWGVPVKNDHKLFEMLILESFQAGLSWITILRKRENFRAAFDGFDYEKVARYRAADLKRLLSNKGIIRNELKIKAAVNNAQRFIEIQEEFESFSNYIWSFTEGKTLRSKRDRTKENMPSKSPESEALSKDLKKRGFSFMGPVVCYAHMQATGMIDDHVKTCFKYKKRK